MTAAPLCVLASAGCSPSQTAPDLPYTLLGGEQRQLATSRGRVMLVNFWATSCTTCVAEMPGLVATYEKFRPQAFDVLAVAMSYDPPTYVSHFATTRKLPFQVAIDQDGRLAQGFGDVQLTPTSFLLDKQQRIVKRYVGEPAWDKLQQLIGELLAQ